MAKTPGVNMQPARGVARPARAPGQKPAASAQAAAPPVPARPRTSVAQFAREVRVEARKTTWTPWRETWVISVMVFIMVALTSIFFLLVDSILSFLIQQILKLAG